MTFIFLLEGDLSEAKADETGSFKMNIKKIGWL
jgi:hypothetical protein